MINLIIGGRQTGRTQKLVEKACSLFLQGKKVGVICSDAHSSANFAKRCMKVLDLLGKYFNDPNHKGPFIYQFNNPSCIQIYSKLENYDSIILDVLIIDDWKNCGFIKIGDTKTTSDLYLSGLPDILSYFIENKINYSIEWCQRPKKQTFTRQEVLDLMEKFKLYSWEFYSRTELDKII